MSNLVVALFLMIKLEFSYTDIFGKNILLFLILFTVFDIVIEQILTRVVMSEALLVMPILGAFVLTEFIMTMGADDFESFIVSYFIETTLVVISRTYIGPFVEYLETFTQKTVFRLSMKYPRMERLFRNVLKKQF